MWSNNKSFTGHMWTHPVNFSGRWSESLFLNKQWSSPGFTSLDSWMIGKSTLPLTHVYDPLIHHVVLLDLTWFDNFWSSFARKSSSTFVELADSPAFALSGIFIITWCDANQNMLENNTTLVKAVGAQAIKNERHKRTPARQVNTNLETSSKTKRHKISPWTNDGKQNTPWSYIVILSPEWWL